MFESFLSNQKEIWSQLANEIGGEFSQSFWTGAKVTASHGPWTVVLDSTYQAKIVFTRLQATYYSADGFEFHIFRKHPFSPIAKFFGLQDIEIGHPDFDDEFIIRSNNPEAVTKFLSSEKLRSLLLCRGEVHLQTVSEPEFTVSQQMTLSIRVPELVTDLHELKDYFDLFGEALDQLCKIGSAGSSS